MIGRRIFGSIPFDKVVVRPFTIISFAAEMVNLPLSAKNHNRLQGDQGRADQTI
jgi:hypothetical protein